MNLVPGPERILADSESNPLEGVVRWAPAKSVWIGFNTLAALVLSPVFVSFDAVLLFVVTSAITLCFGHSVGMHRRLIHSSFECPHWLEYLCVYLGTLVGMAGPLGMIRVHDYRDWAQRQTDCHDFFRHGRRLLHDGWWQLHCELVLSHPPKCQLEPRLENSRFYKYLERTWMLQQLPWAVAFYAFGGWAWVVWGIFVRVSVCVTGHWLVGHFAHRQGGQHWIVEGAAAQGYNVKLAGIISMGESWHNNHHAFPGSAKLGLYPGEVDLGWQLIRVFRMLGIARTIKEPAHLPPRANLRQIDVSRTRSRFETAGAK